MKFVALTLLLAGIYAIYEIGLKGRSLGSISAQSGDTAGATQGVQGTSGNYYGLPTGTGSSPNGIPPSTLFTRIAGALTGFGENVSAQVANADAAGLKAKGGGSLWHDLNFGTIPAGTAVYLPWPGSYTYLGNSQGLWGNLLYFRTPNGGVVGFPHLQNIPSLVVGQTVPGGSQIGVVGNLGAPNAFWSGPHLAVILDNLAAAYFNGLQQLQSGGQAA